MLHKMGYEFKNQEWKNWEVQYIIHLLSTVKKQEEKIEILTKELKRLKER